MGCVSPHPLALPHNSTTQTPFIPTALINVAPQLPLCPDRQMSLQVPPVRTAGQITTSIVEDIFSKRCWSCWKLIGGR